MKKEQFAQLIQLILNKSINGNSEFGFMNKVYRKKNTLSMSFTSDPGYSQLYEEKFEIIVNKIK